jgi:hypothetical protein
MSSFLSGRFYGMKSNMVQSVDLHSHSHYSRAMGRRMRRQNEVSKAVLALAERYLQVAANLGAGWLTSH